MNSLIIKCWFGFQSVVDLVFHGLPSSTAVRGVASMWHGSDKKAGKAVGFS